MMEKLTGNTGMALRQDIFLGDRGTGEEREIACLQSLSQKEAENKDEVWMYRLAPHRVCSSYEKSKQIHRKPVQTPRETTSQVMNRD